MVVHELDNKQAYEAVLKDNKFVILEAHKVGCFPSRAMIPYFENLAAKYSHAYFVKVQYPNYPAITGLPSPGITPKFIISKDGNKVKELEAVDPEELEKAIFEVVGEAKDS